MRITPIGRIIREARIATGTTMVDMATFLGMKPSAVCAIETGKTPMPPGFLNRVADFFNAVNLERYGDILEIQRMVKTLLSNDDDKLSMHPDAVFDRQYMAGDPEARKRAHLFDE